MKNNVRGEMDKSNALACDTRLMGRRWLKGEALVVTWIAIMLISISAGPPTRPEAHSSRLFEQAQQPNYVLSIDGNDSFVYWATTKGWPGNGSASNPYIIEDWLIASIEGAVSISQVSVYFVIRDCDFSNIYLTYPCVLFSNVSHGAIEHCIIQSARTGVAFCDVRNCILDTNTIGGYRDALILTSSYNCTITNNVFVSGGVGFGSMEEASFRHVFSNNTVMGRQLGYFRNASSYAVYGGLFGQIILVGCEAFTVYEGDFSGIPCGVLLVGCRDCFVKYCDVYNATFGVTVMACDRVTVLGGNFSWNVFAGLSVNRSSNCLVAGNSLLFNQHSGINVLGQDVSIVDNIVYSSGDGIVVIGADPDMPTIGGLVTGNVLEGNQGYGIILGTEVTRYVIYDNTLVMNSVNAWDSGFWNSWDNGVDTGNEWSDYSGQGVYQVPGDARSIDHYPRYQSGIEGPTSPIVDGVDHSPESVLVLWFFFSVAVVTVPVFLMIRLKRS